MHAKLIGALALAFLSARAASPSQTPDWSADRFLLGEWSCEMTRPGREPDHERAVYSLGLGDSWLKLTYTLTPHDRALPALTAEAYETFDPRLSKWVYVSLRSDGTYSLSYSDGWKGQQKIYGPASDAKDRWRLIALKVSDTAFTETMEIPATGSSWQQSASLHCNKVK